jgi:hypothetical protein
MLQIRVHVLLQACVREADELKSRVAALEAELAAARDEITQERATAAAVAAAAVQAKVQGLIHEAVAVTRTSVVS